MARLATSINVSQHLKAKYSLGLAILPFSMMIGSLGLPLVLISVLSNYFGVAFDDVKNVDVGIVGIAIVILCLMKFGYMVGWWCNELIARFILGWGKDKTNRVYRHCELPPHWYKKGGKEQADLELLNQIWDWRHKRAKGHLRFVLLITGLFYGLYAFHLLIFQPFSKGFAWGQWQYLLWPGILWAGGSALLGVLLWHLSERAYQKNRRRLIEKGIDPDQLEAPESIIEALPSTKTTRTSLALAMIFPIICVLTGIAFFGWYLSNPNGETPDKNSLIVFSDRIASIKTQKSGIRFKFEGSQDTYYYPANHRDMPLIHHHLANSKGLQVTVLAQFQLNKKLSNEDPKRYKVFEVVVGDKVVKSYQEVAETLISRHRLMVFIMGLFMISTGLFLGWQTYKNYRQSNQEQ